MRAWIALALILAPATIAAKPAPASDAALIAKVKAAARHDLRDPGSAQFRDMSVKITPSGGKIVCGEINAKNAYGGYIGFVPFYWLDGSVVRADENEWSVKLVAVACSR